MDREFDDAQRDAFRALAASMSFVGVCALLFGVLAAFFALLAAYAGFALDGVGIAVGAAACALVAWWTMSAGRSLSALVRTRGRDVEHLMEAVRHLRLLFGFARVVIIVYALAIVGLAGLVVWCTFVRGSGGMCWGAIG